MKKKKLKALKKMAREIALSSESIQIGTAYRFLKGKYKGLSNKSKAHAV